MPEVGQLIHNKYRLVRLIGDGGMGSVYEAHHEVLGTNVALKFLHPELARRSGLVQRFLQEARVSARIQSPHVVRVTDVDQTPEGLAFIVMEFLKGKSLQNMYEDLYRAGKRLSYEEGLDYTVQMMEGLEAAHAEGVVHRDLKPDNVMITKNRKGVNVLKVLDFGIAKLKVEGELGKKGLTRPGVVMGTPEYMAPEQAFSADAVDARADIFSLGVMVFEMLAGRRPVGGDEAHQIAAQYLTGQVAKLSDLMPDIPDEICAAVHKAMAASKENRFASVAEFREVIEPFADAVKKPKPAGATPAGDSGGKAKITPAAENAAVAQSAPDPSDSPAASPIPLGTPATNVPSVEPSSELPARVAKTLPPDDDSGVPPPAAAGQGGNGARMGIVAPSVPPAYDQTSEGLGSPSHPLIPIGDATEEQAPIDALARHEAESATKQPKAKKTGTEIMKAPEGATADRAKKKTPEPGASPIAASVGALPATRTAAPLEAALLTEQGAPIAAAVTPSDLDAPNQADAPANGFGATVAADATAPGFDPSATEPYEPAPLQGAAARPGGTAVGNAPGTMDMSPGVAAAQPAPRVAAAPAGPHSRRRGRGAKKAGGLSVFSILLLATAIAGAVTGGVYLASEYSTTSGDDDDTELIETKKKKKGKKKTPSPPPEPVTVAGDPTTPPDPTVEDPPTATTPPPPPPPTATAKPQPTTKPQPSATSKPEPSATSKPEPSAAPTPTFTVPILPSGPPILPSSLPNMFPGFRPPPKPAPTSTGPSEPPPPPPPPSGKKPPRFRIPGKSTQNVPDTIDRGGWRMPAPAVVTGTGRRSPRSAG